MTVTVKKPVVLVLTLVTVVGILCVLSPSLYSTSPPSRPSSSCLGLTTVEQLLDMLSDELGTKPACFGDLKILLDRVYNVETFNTEIDVPENMVEMVRDKWFNGDQMLYGKFKKPKVLTVTDRYSFETTTVNPLRAMRPNLPDKGEELARVKKIIQDSRDGCNFCNDKQTLTDSFGRVYWEKSHIFTSENAFRFFDYTGMVIPADVHDFTELDAQTFEALFAYAAVTWFGNIKDKSPDKTHPILVWDLLEKAGGSQVHPHITIFAGSGFYPGKMGHLEDAGKRYQTATGGDYLQDIVDIHVALGLGFRHKSAAVVVPITPNKDREIWVIGSTDLLDFIWLYFLAFRSYIEELQVYCSSHGMALPSTEIGSKEPIKSPGNLMVAKMGSRGDCFSVHSDVSSLELYTINSISTDYYQTFAAVKKTYEKYRQTHPEKYEGV